MQDPVSPQAAPTQAGFEALVDGAPSVYIISLSGTLSQTHYIRDGTHCRSGSRGCPRHVTQCSDFRHGVVLDDCDRLACIERPRRYATGVEGSVATIAPSPKVRRPWLIR